MVDAVDVLGWWADREVLARYAGELLTPSEIDDLVESLGGDDFSVEDIPLLDELRYLLGEAPAPEAEHDPLDDLYDELVPELTTSDQRRDGEGIPVRDGERPTARSRTTGYAHLLVDEAQDLSPMQWRMLGRRGRYASWTIVGDPAQSSWGSPDEAAAARARCAARQGRELVPALDQLPQLRRDLRPGGRCRPGARSPAPTCPDAVRRTGVEPRAARGRAAVPRRDRARGRRRACTTLVDGTIGVVVPVGWR